MKNTTLLLSIFSQFLFAANSFSQSEQPALVINHLAGDFYIYTTYHQFNNKPFPSNSMYLVTNKGVVLFDTPWDSTQFQPILDSIEKRHHQKVVLCISGHFHADRTAGVDYFKQKGIKTYSSKMTYDLCKANNQKQPEFYFLRDTAFTVGNHTFQTFYPGGGHTNDNIVIWFPDEKIIYGGCFVKSTDANDLGNIDDANLSEWPRSVERTMKKFPNPRYVIPGHFNWQNNGGLEHTLELLRNSNSKKS